MGLEIFRFAGSPAQQRSLAACAEAWQSSGQPFWSLAETLQMLQRDSCAAFFLAAQAEAAAWAGVALVDSTAELQDLLYLFVPEAERRQGAGRILLAYLLQKGTPLILEVRPSNTAALALYRSQGCSEVGRRRAYYQNGEDALVLKHPGVECR